MTTRMRHENVKSDAVAIWLWLVAALIFCMVIVGGATRLTDSGLSITEWQPVLGAIPPLTGAHWQDAFSKYQQIPEYQVQNRGMSLEEFKVIYWWEWSHRFLGRMIGIVYALPLMLFIAAGKISRSRWPRLATLFALGGVQGALGWFMVASGLSERVDVSQYRLAAHLTLAVALFAGVVWTALNWNRPGGESSSVWQGEARMTAALLVLLFAQVALGGFVAGLDAGHAANTWPKMNGAWLPDGLLVLSPWWKNAFENALAAQFSHRALAYCVLAFTLLLAWRSRLKSAWAIVAAALVQMALGILTVLWGVPLGAALTHQAGALVLVALVLWHLHLAANPEPVPGRR